MFYIYDKQAHKSLPQGYTMRCNAERRCQAINIKQCGIDEVDKPEQDRRYIVVTH